MPDDLFQLTPIEFTDMWLAKLHYQSKDADAEMQRTAWQTSLLMSASGNYGKKGIEAKKLYQPMYDTEGNIIEKKDSDNKFTPIDRDEKDKKMNELLAKFNN